METIEHLLSYIDRIFDRLDLHFYFLVWLFLILAKHLKINDLVLV